MEIVYCPRCHKRAWPTGQFWICRNNDCPLLVVERVDTSARVGTLAGLDGALTGGTSREVVGSTPTR